MQISRTFGLELCKLRESFDVADSLRSYKIQISTRKSASILRSFCDHLAIITGMSASGFKLSKSHWTKLCQMDIMLALE